MVLLLLGAILVLGFGYEQIARRRERALTPPGRLIDVGGYRLHLTDEGQGGPAVVIIAGAGESSYSWAYVRQQLAPTNRVLSYDRPGLGSSDSGPGLDPVRSVDELHALLDKAGVPGPYVLVGHSLGGLIARLYAMRYPEQVAGMVMVDSTHEFLAEDKKFRQGYAAIGFMLRVLRATAPFGLQRFLGSVLGVLPMYPEHGHYRKQVTPDQYQQWQAIAYRNVVRDGGIAELTGVFAMMEAGRRQMTDGTNGPQFGDLPMVVLTNPGFGEDWANMHRELASRSSNSVHWFSDQSGHNLQMPRPDLVVKAVRHVAGELSKAV